MKKLKQFICYLILFLLYLPMPYWIAIKPEGLFATMTSLSKFILITLTTIIWIIIYIDLDKEYNKNRKEKI